MDLDEQAEIQRVATRHPNQPLLVMLGSANADSAEIAALTVTTGDPTFAGPLAGVPLGLPVYHVLESEVKAVIPPEVFSEQVGMMELVLDVAAIEAALRRVRQEAGVDSSPS